MTKDEILEKIIENYTLSSTDFEQLKSSYEDIAKWLAKDELIQSHGDVEILPQGSLALGTIVKPIDEEDDFDVDLLAKIDSEYFKGKPKELKQIVGHRLMQHERYKKNMTEGKRCWTIEYSNRHADILPCIPNYVSSDFLITTEKKAENHYVEHSTNPIGYKKWFFQQGAKGVLLENAKIQELTCVKSRSNLQKIVQLCKLHRNYYYYKNKKNEDDKPISIIISTLAGYTYPSSQSFSLYEDFLYVVKNMRQFISNNNGEYFVKNPVDSKENFADKWKIHPERKSAFFEWLELLESNIDELSNAKNLFEEAKILKKMFGEKAINCIYANQGNYLYSLREQGVLYMGDKGVLNNKSGHKVEKHTFFGSDD